MSRHFIPFEGIEIEYELTRKNVKYINLRVNKYGKVVVSAGKHVPFEAIDEFVRSKAFWIIMHLAEVEKIKNDMPDTSLYDGKTVYYLGKPYHLLLERGEKNIFFEGDVLNFYYPSMKSDVLKEVYLEWLKEEAEKKFEEVMDRIHPMVAEYRIKRPQIKVRNMKSIWGSCTTTGSAIRLNLQLMKADEACIEQVVLHELLHFRYPNHGKSFYDLLEQLMPDWKERKEKLEKNFKDGV